MYIFPWSVRLGEADVLATITSDAATKYTVSIVLHCIDSIHPLIAADRAWRGEALPQDHTGSQGVGYQRCEMQFRVLVVGGRVEKLGDELGGDVGAAAGVAHLPAQRHQ